MLVDEGAQPPDLVLIGTGSEVALAVAARATLAERGLSVRVVSMPSWELFEEQTDEYRSSVLPPIVRRSRSRPASASVGSATPTTS